MTTVIGGSYPAVNSDSDATINGLTVGKGTNAVSNNTALGVSALASGSLSGGLNTGVGSNALILNTSGTRNTAVGAFTQNNQTTGASNSSLGVGALNVNSTGSFNTSIGDGSLGANTTASNNTAVGYQAGYSNTTGAGNAFFGQQAGYSSTGSYNAFLGAYAGYFSTGSGNTFVGINSTTGNGAGYNMTTGSDNTILGGYNGNQGISGGPTLDLRTGSNNIVLSDGDGNPRLWVNNQGTMQSYTNANGDVCMYMVNYGNSTPFGLQLTFQNATPNNTSQFFFLGNDSTNNKVVLYSNGTVTNRTGTYNAFSDINLKQDIVDASSQWDDIKAVRVRKFRLKDDVVANSEAKPMIGVIAQELEQTSAGLIDDCKDRDGTVTKAVKYSILYMKAIKALQEAMERIETLEAKVQQLENK